jgi:hypothetical protein
MNIPVQDRSNYLKGLLIIARKDNQLAEEEKQIIKNLALKLGFASDFYEETIRNLLNNKYISDEPIRFSDPLIAESFITDGFKVAFSDTEKAVIELSWLKETCILNGISEEWFEKKLSHYKKSEKPSADFALFSLI